MARAMTFLEKQEEAGGASTAFNYLRLGLALSVLVWHSFHNATGDTYWNTHWRFLTAAGVPSFFALSGYLNAGSLGRNSLRNFLLSRMLRILPALVVEVTLSAIVIGLIFTDMPRLQYLKDTHFLIYFTNIFGFVHFWLPGVFTHNIGGHDVNAQLWTIPFEFLCYIALAAMSLLMIVRNRFLFFCVALGLTIAYTLWKVIHGGAPQGHVPGPGLVFAFLAAVALFRYRDVMPYSNTLALLAAISAGICYEFPITCYIGAFPIAYLTIWIGLKRPPPIPFGDLSYGIYLFHYPFEQMIMHLFPQIDTWWELTLAALPPTMFFAFLSWTLIERPILLHKKSITAAVDRFLALLEKRSRRPRTQAAWQASGVLKHQQPS